MIFFSGLHSAAAEVYVKPTYTTRVTSPAGAFTAFILTKRDVPAESAYLEIARQLDVSRSHVSDFGMKDRHAVTAQIIVVAGAYRPRFYHEKMWLYQIGPAAQALWHGQHAGNHFSIFVQSQGLPPFPRSEFINLFGPQRFGDGFVEVGRLLLEGQMAAAADILLASPKNSQKLQKIMSQYRLPAIAAIFHSDFSYELKMKIHGWQSYLWNERAADWDGEFLPLWRPKNASLYRRLWNPDLTRLDTGMVQQLNTAHRPVMATARRHTVTHEPQGYRHEFALPSGSYGYSIPVSVV